MVGLASEHGYTWKMSRILTACQRATFGKRLDVELFLYKDGPTCLREHLLQRIHVVRDRGLSVSPPVKFTVYVLGCPSSFAQDFELSSNWEGLEVSGTEWSLVRTVRHCVGIFPPLGCCGFYSETRFGFTIARRSLRNLCN
jgi:hypothetical protein